MPALDIGELRRIRLEYKTNGFLAKTEQKKREIGYSPLMPSEHFMDTIDHGPQTPKIDSIDNVSINWNYTTLRVAVAQLKSMELASYCETTYRIRNHAACPAFEKLLTRQLDELKYRCDNLPKNPSGNILDMLVFPEVFIPRSFISQLRKFSNETGSIIIAGIDYPGDAEETNANECIIIRPNTEPHFYRKITRSQYDARETDGGFMPLERGHKFIRFVNDEGQGFGVLICFDYSHFDIVYQLNMKDREYPLDVLVVVAYNPFAKLYRSCCIADAHRFYQYIVMCNTAEYGSSGVFGPVRTPGENQVLIDAGKGVETISVAELNIKGLQNARKMSDDLLHHDRDFMRRPGIFQASIKT